MESQQGNFLIEDPEIVRIPASQLDLNYLDLQASFGTQTIRFLSKSSFHCQFVKLLFIVSSDLREGTKVQMPHPTREIANGRPAFCLRIMPWADDVSGNRSKQYNAHVNIYVANVNLPHRKLAQEYFVRFCSTSPHASASEQFVALSEDL